MTACRIAQHSYWTLCKQSLFSPPATFFWSSCWTTACSTQVFGSTHQLRSSFWHDHQMCECEMWNGSLSRSKSDSTTISQLTSWPTLRRDPTLIHNLTSAITFQSQSHRSLYHICDNFQITVSHLTISRITISHLWSLADLLKRPASLDSAADDAHLEVVLLGGEAWEGERGLPQGARHQQTLRGRHRHHQVCPFDNVFACQLSFSQLSQFENV